MASDTAAEQTIEDRELREADEAASEESAEVEEFAGIFRDYGSNI
jgi:hypothetical protein